MSSYQRLRAAALKSDLAAGWGPYDIFLATWGYEHRSSFLPMELGSSATKRYAVSFPEQHELSFNANAKRLKGRGFHLVDGAQIDYGHWVTALIRRSASAHRPLRFLHDISSTNRERLATVVETLAAVGREAPIVADFVYAPARFSPPETDEAAIVDAGPVTSTFAGWVPELDRPPIGIVGVGYERDRALGSLEYLDVAEAWAFVPEGEDTRYDHAVAKMNAALWGAVPADHTRKYNVSDPYGTLIEVASVLDGTVGNSRPIILPFGPKVFTLVALIAALLYAPRAAVWRVSSGARTSARQRRAAGHAVGLRLEILPAVDETDSLG